MPLSAHFSLPNKARLIVTFYGAKMPLIKQICWLSCVADCSRLTKPWRPFNVVATPKASAGHKSALYQVFRKGMRLNSTDFTCSHIHGEQERAFVSKSVLCPHEPIAHHGERISLRLRVKRQLPKSANAMKASLPSKSLFQERLLFFFVASHSV